MANDSITPPSRSKSVPRPPPAVLRLGMVGAIFPASLLGAVSRRTPSNSKRTAVGSNPSLALATTNTRRRRWATPKYWASVTRHATALLGPSTAPAFVHLPPGATSGSSSPASPARKQPNALSLVLRTPGTFSQKTMVGCSPRTDRAESISLAISQKVKERLPRASSKDLRRPATENAWHGVPPQKTSGASISPLRMRSAIFVMSPRFGTSG